MSSSLYEIVELADGQVGLRRAGEDGEPLVTIAFSSDALAYIQDAKLEVVKAMIEAGLEVTSELLESQEPEFDGELRVLH